ncbi:MAG: hypothetical protein K9N55_01105 [Phycisphaerae bacterium]|nr:hypothetical protein [Phycisphaerae bacterium]
MATWEIYKPSGECAATGTKIESGEEYYGALVDSDEGLVRKDFCTTYWDQEKPTVYCYWKTRLPYPNQKKKVFLDDEMLMAFFDRLENDDQQERVNFRFVLALILMRKRRLKYECSVIREGHEIWTLKVTGEKRQVEVDNPHLDEAQIEQLSQQMGQVLNADLESDE